MPPGSIGGARRRPRAPLPPCASACASTQPRAPVAFERQRRGRAKRRHRGREKHGDRAAERRATSSALKERRALRLGNIVHSYGDDRHKRFCMIVDIG
eukprot:5583534-Pleurochrysis_carterae.AAC.1